jgi:hypothetical protein
MSWGQPQQGQGTWGQPQQGSWGQQPQLGQQGQTGWGSQNQQGLNQGFNQPSVGWTLIA